MNALYWHALAAVRCAQRYGLDIPPVTIRAVAVVTLVVERGGNFAFIKQ